IHGLKLKVIRGIKAKQVRKVYQDKRAQTAKPTTRGLNTQTPQRVGCLTIQVVKIISELPTIKNRLLCPRNTVIILGRCLKDLKVLKVSREKMENLIIHGLNMRMMRTVMECPTIQTVNYI